MEKELIEMGFPLALVQQATWMGLDREQAVEHILKMQGEQDWEDVEEDQDKEAKGK
jgi:hypothetical protein